MAKGKADVSNFAIRILLQEMGKIYDLKRELPLWSEKHFPEVKAYFDNKCCYCGTDRKKLHKDHLVPINRTALGLDAWGNVLPACQDCNSSKQSSDWIEFLRQKSDDEFQVRHDRIKSFVTKYSYAPSVEPIRVAVEELYDEAGAIVLELIRLKLKRIVAASDI